MHFPPTGPERQPQKQRKLLLAIQFSSAESAEKSDKKVSHRAVFFVVAPVQNEMGAITPLLCNETSNPSLL